MTPEERLERYDQELESVKDALVEALDTLQQEPAVHKSFDERLTALVERLNGFRGELQPDDFDKDQMVAIFRALFNVRDTVDAVRGRSPDLDTCDQLLVNIERIRHVVRDALDEYVTGVSDDRGLVLNELRERLPNTPLAAVAELVGVNRRTLSRWRNEATPPPHRLRVVARLVAILQHNWNEDGIMAWFDRPRRELGDRKPRALLADASAEYDLVTAARSGRSQYAS
jgi:transcriptional regulator with XRE-family HTH domain